MGSKKAGLKKSLGCACRDASGIPFWGFVKSGLSFSLRPKRFLPFFVIGLALLAIEVAFLSVGMGTDALLLYADYGIPQEYVPAFAAMLALQAAVWVAGIFVTGALIRQSMHPSESMKSFRAALRSLPSLLTVALVFGILYLLVSLAPYVGTVLSAVVALTFLFSNQCVVVSGMRFDRALLSSARLLVKKPLAVLFAGIATAAIGAFLIIAFASPMVAVLYYYFGGDISVQLSSGVLFESGGPDIKAVLIVSILGQAIMNVFVIKFLTDVYQHFRKKKFTA